jgi:hypothetical protein
MNEKMLNDVCREVNRRFPETRGTKPKLQRYGTSSGRPASASPKYLLIFQAHGVTDNNRNMAYIVRVVVNAQGKILRMSMSH